MNVGRPVDGLGQSSVKVSRQIKKKKKLPLLVKLRLTFNSNGDWQRLDSPGADAQPAAILPSILSVHILNAATQHTQGDIILCTHTETFSHFTIRSDVRHGGDESGDPICGGLELVDQHLAVF